MDNLTELYCLMDDFCQEFEPQLNSRLISEGKRWRIRVSGLSLAELMTLAILFHQLRYRQFKVFYLNHVCSIYVVNFQDYLRINVVLNYYHCCAAAFQALFDKFKGQCTGISIVDSTPLCVCDNLRIRRHRAFHGMAQRGKSSTGWFFGFKLHAVINHVGELIAVRLTADNVDDRKPVPQLGGMPKNPQK